MITIINYLKSDNFEDLVDSALLFGVVLAIFFMVLGTFNSLGA